MIGIEYVILMVILGICITVANFKYYDKRYNNLTEEELEWEREIQKYRRDYYDYH